MIKKSYIAEAIGPFSLVFCGTGAIVINEFTSGTVTHVGIAIGGIILLETLFAGSISPAVVSGHFEYLWLYIIAPILGTLLAVMSCRLVKDAQCCDEVC